MLAVENRDDAPTRSKDALMQKLTFPPACSIALGTAPKVKALLNTSSPGFNPAHFIMSIMALPQELSATQYLCPVYRVISTSHLDTVDSWALGTL
jgi:hypothetical protein